MHHRGLIAASTVTGVAIAGGSAARAGSDDTYDPRAVETRVKCRVAPGAALPSLRLTRAQTIRATRRLVLRHARSRSTMLGRLVKGRRFTLKMPGTVEQPPARGDGENVRTGGSYELIFSRPTAVSGIVPATGYAPRGFSRRYTRRYGYMPYLVGVSGTVTGLDVVVDLRDHRIQQVAEAFNSPSLRQRPVPGRCPLAQQPPSND